MEEPFEYLRMANLKFNEFNTNFKNETKTGKSPKLSQFNQIQIPKVFLDQYRRKQSSRVSAEECTAAKEDQPSLKREKKRVLQNNDRENKFMEEHLIFLKGYLERQDQ